MHPSTDEDLDKLPHVIVTSDDMGFYHSRFLD